MSTRKASFKQADAARALKAAVAAGLRPNGYTIGNDGSITVSLSNGEVVPGNSFDQIMGRSG